jgi:hypothetical protein
MSNNVSNGSHETRCNVRPWINPVGGLGDILMLSGVLKHLYENYKRPCYNLVRRSKQSSLLRCHPAIYKVGFPPKGSRIITNDYWSYERLGGGSQRAYQILARHFDLKTPIEETLYLPMDEGIDHCLFKEIPISDQTIVIAPTSDSPRKMMPAAIWVSIVQLLKDQGCFVIQVGLENDELISGAYSLLGLTTPFQAMNIIARVRGVITIDNFIMHIAHLLKKKAVVIWGPTSPEVYGYDGHKHIRVFRDHCCYKNQCLGPEYSQNYAQKCPLGNEHCMGTISAKKIVDTLESE